MRDAGYIPRGAASPCLRTKHPLDKMHTTLKDVASCSNTTSIALDLAARARSSAGNSRLQPILSSNRRYFQRHETYLECETLKTMSRRYLACRNVMTSSDRAKEAQAFIDERLVLAQNHPSELFLNIFHSSSGSVCVYSLLVCKMRASVQFFLGYLNHPGDIPLQSCWRGPRSCISSCEETPVCAHLLNAISSPTLEKIFSMSERETCASFALVESCFSTHRIRGR